MVTTNKQDVMSLSLTSIGAGEGVGPEQPHGSVDVLVLETGVGLLQELVDVGLVGLPELLVLQGPVSQSGVSEGENNSLP